MDIQYYNDQCFGTGIECVLVFSDVHDGVLMMKKVPKSHTESLKKVIKDKPKPRGKVDVSKREIKRVLDEK